MNGVMVNPLLSSGLENIAARIVPTLRKPKNPPKRSAETARRFSKFHSHKKKDRIIAPVNVTTHICENTHIPTKKQR